MAREGHKLAKIDDHLKKLKGCLKVVEVQCEVNEQVMTANERKEQNGKGNIVNRSGGSNNENKQQNKDGQCAAPIAGHKNHKWTDCKYNKESNNYCGHHWKKDIKDGKVTKINANKEDKKDVSKMMT